MPCNTIQTSQVEFLAKSTNPELLAEALRALGYTVFINGHFTQFTKGYQTGTYNALTGQLTMPQQWDGNEIKRAYSREIVNSQAKKNGWKVSWSVNENGEQEATVERRS